MQAVKVQTDGTIKLPREILRLFPRASELAVWAHRDTIVLKRLSLLKPSRFAERTPSKGMPGQRNRGHGPMLPNREVATKPATRMSLKEIVAEVHRMRREKRSQRG